MWTIDTVAFCTSLSNEYGSDVAAPPADSAEDIVEVWYPELTLSK